MKFVVGRQKVNVTIPCVGTENFYRKIIL